MSELYPRGFNIGQGQNPVHTEGRVMEWVSKNTKEEVEILLLARSSDLNPIENVWG